MSQSPDEKFFLWMNGWAGRSRAADQLWRGAAFLVPFVSTLTCLAVLVHDPHAARHFWLMAGAVAGAQIVTRLVRLAWHRPRPYLNAHLHVRRLLDKGDEAAFPSAHASSLFALAVTVLPFSPAVGCALLMLAALNAVARVVTGVHYPSDVLAGATLGVAVGALIGFLLWFLL